MATLIRTPQDLHNVRNNKTGDFELANDIDMSEWGNFEPIGGVSSDQRFRGNFDGKGYSIKNITIKENVYNSIFGYVGSGNIRNLRVENAISESDNNYTAILFSYYNGDDENAIENCHVSGEVNGWNNAGGLGGYVYRGNIRNCYSTANVSGRTVAGLVKHIIALGYIENSYSTGKITQMASDGTSGGLTGSGVVDNVINSYWDIESSGISTSFAGEGKTTAEMKDQSTYVGWDFDDTWAMNGDYPYLQVLGEEVVPAKQESRNVSAYMGNIYSNAITNIVRQPISHNIEVNSHMSPISSHTDQFLEVFRSVKGYSSPIHSNVSTVSLSSTKEMRDVTSYMNTLSSHVVTEVIRQPLKVTKDITSHMSQIQANTDVSMQVSAIPIQVYVSVLENPSNVDTYQHLSNSTFMENPSYCEVVK